MSEQAPRHEDKSRGAFSHLAPPLAAGARPLVIAHRGNSSVAPENTLSAFRSAIEIGVDGVELDYQHSADGVPVVFHDETLDRTTNAAALWTRSQVNLADCTLSQLRQLDTGRWFDAIKFNDEPFATLEESLDLICGAGAICVIERKAGDAATLVALLRRKQRIDRVVVMAFDWEFLADCWQIEPELRLVALGEGELSEARLDEIAASHATIVGWNQKSLTAESIAAIHRHGFQAWTWTVDEPVRMKELIAAGIDAITSNYPARLMCLFGRIIS